MIGQTLDRYRIESKLGEGGMGVVYKARDTHLDRAVAIKVLPRDKVSNPDRKRRFVQEAKAASALNHPGIVTVYDIRSEAGTDFIVMEYVSGRTLDQIIPPKGLRPQQALRYGVAIADALAKAHDAGIVHRDLKPSNVMVTDEGRIKVLDFGLAKLRDVADASDEVNTQTAALKTDAGTVVGTAAYMSPEQAEGRKLDGRSDIFSFGSVLYEMVTGRRPFIGESPLSTLTKVLNEDPPPPSRLATSVSPELDRTILRCLRKDPARRYQTMADLKVTLEDLETDSTSGVQAVVVPGRVRRRSLWIWTAVAAAALVAVAAYVATRVRQPQETPSPLRAIPLTSLPGVKRSPSFSADGNQVAFSWSGPEQNNTDIYVQQIGAGSPLRLTNDPADDYSPLWSPDGRSIAFLRRQADRHELRLIPPLGGPERKLTDLHPVGAFLRAITLAWCPDSSCVVVTDSPGASSKRDALFAVSVESGEKRQLTDPQGQVLADNDPAVSPDGKWLVFRRDSAPFNGELYRVPLGKNLSVTGEPVRLTRTQLTAYNPRWLPDSSEIVFSARGALWRLRVPEGGEPIRLPFVGEDGLQPTISRAQPGQPTRLVYVRAFSDLNIWRVETPAQGAATTSPPVVAISSTRRDFLAQLSPDNRRLTFLSDRSGESELWVADTTGANAIQLTSMGANPGFPRWSPDGELIAFHSNPDGNAEVFVVPASGGKPRNVTSDPAAIDAFPSFSRDGRWIYFSSSRKGAAQIWKIPVAGGEPVPVSSRSGQVSIESIDGADLYYVESGTDRPGPLLRQPAQGGVAVKMLDDVQPFGFDVVERGVYYIERVGNEGRLRYFDFGSGISTLVARNLGATNAGLTATRDGRVILYTRTDSTVDELMLVENFR